MRPSEPFRAFVYRNLHRQQFSLRAVDGPRKGRVVGYADSLLMTGGVVFSVSAAGRTRVRRSGHREVHAGVTGCLFLHPCAPDDLADWLRVTYNPFVHDTLVLADTGAPIHDADCAWFTNNQVYVPRPR